MPDARCLTGGRINLLLTSDSMQLTARDLISQEAKELIRQANQKILLLLADWDEAQLLRIHPGRRYRPSALAERCLAPPGF